MRATRAWLSVMAVLWSVGLTALAGMLYSSLQAMPYVTHCSLVFLTVGIALPVAGSMVQVTSQRHYARLIGSSREADRMVRRGRRYRRITVIATMIGIGLASAAWLVHDVVLFVGLAIAAFLPFLVAIIAAFGPDVAGELQDLQRRLCRA